MACSAVRALAASSSRSALRAAFRSFLAFALPTVSGRAASRGRRRPPLNLMTARDPRAAPPYALPAPSKRGMGYEEASSLT